MSDPVVSSSGRSEPEWTCPVCGDTGECIHMSRLLAAVLPDQVDPEKCLCDGGSYGPQDHPFLVSEVCPIHGSGRSSSAADSESVKERAAKVIYGLAGDPDECWELATGLAEAGLLGSEAWTQDDLDVIRARALETAERLDWYQSAEAKREIAALREQLRQVEELRDELRASLEPTESRIGCALDTILSGDVDLSSACSGSTELATSGPRCNENGDPVAASPGGITPEDSLHRQVGAFIAATAPLLGRLVESAIHAMADQDCDLAAGDTYDDATYREHATAAVGAVLEHLAWSDALPVFIDSLTVQPESYPTSFPDTGDRYDIVDNGDGTASLRPKAPPVQQGGTE